jgi:uncharacterized membrane-anchored protein
MKYIKSDWVKNPTKKQVVMASLIWLIGLILLLLPMTDFFSESPLKRKFLGVALLLVMATFTLFCVYLNYFRNRSKT